MEDRIFETDLTEGIKIPILGLGTYGMDDKTAERCVKTALDLGYRLIDTASSYENERGVGTAIRKSAVDRDDIFVTSKAGTSEQGYHETQKAIDRTLDRLELDRVDLYLVHWPVEGKIVETWKAMEKIQKEGKAAAIGVSNFHEQHMEELQKNADLMPCIDQIETHPYLQQSGLHDYCRKKLS